MCHWLVMCLGASHSPQLGFSSLCFVWVVCMKTNPSLGRKGVPWACRAQKHRHPTANTSIKYSLLYPSHFGVIAQIILIIQIGLHEKITINSLLCQLSPCTLNISISNIKKKINLFFLHGIYYFKCYFISALEFLVFFWLGSNQVIWQVSPKVLGFFH